VICDGFVFLGSSNTRLHETLSALVARLAHMGANYLALQR